MVALATYMGHVNIYATYWYLEATADLMRDVRRGRGRVHVRWEAIMTPIAPLIEVFLCETLARQRGVSRHTARLLCPELQLLFVFAAERLKVKPSALTLEQIDGRPDQRLPGVSRGYAQKTRRDAQRSGWRPSSRSSASSNIGNRQPWSRSAASWRSRSRRRINAWSVSSAGGVASRA